MPRMIADLDSWVPVPDRFKMQLAIRRHGWRVLLCLAGFSSVGYCYSVQPRERLPSTSPRHGLALTMRVIHPKSSRCSLR